MMPAGKGHDFDLLLKPIFPTELLFEVGKVVDGFSLNPRCFPCPSERFMVEAHWDSACLFARTFGLTLHLDGTAQYHVDSSW